METVKRKDKLHTVAVSVFLGIAFLFMFLLKGYGGAGDSESYLTMGITREPVYPLLLWLLQAFWGVDNFFIPLAFIQNVLAAVSCMLLTHYFGAKIFHSNIGKWIAAVILLMPYLMTPIFSRTHLVMTNKVMSEGITLPAYYLFVLFLLKMIYEEIKVKHMVISSIIVLFLVLTRGQLLPAIIILAIVLCVDMIRKKTYRKLWIPMILAIGIYCCSSLITGIYHYCNSGVFTATASSKPMILANALYVSVPEDGLKIKNPDIKAIFDRTYAELDKNRMLAKYADGSLIDKARYHEACHDSISFDYFELIKNDIFVDRMGSNYTEYMIVQDEIAGELTKELLTHNYGRYLKNYIAVCSLGFVRSIAIDKSILPYYALVMYVVGIMCIIVIWEKRGFTNSLFFFIMTYIMIIGFVMSTSLILQCITRYMIYNLPFFYLAGLAVLNDFRKDKKDGI